MSARFLALHSSDELYGSDRVFYDVMIGLHCRGYQPVVVLPMDVPGGGVLSRRLAAAGLEVHRRNLAVLRRRYLRPLGLPPLAARMLVDIVLLTRFAREHRCELVYTNTTAVQSGALMAWLTGRPHVWHVHEIVESPRFLSKLLRSSLAWFSTEVITVSNAVAEWVGRLPRPVSVIHNGIDEPRPSVDELQAVRARLLEGRRGPLVGWVGRVGQWKGHEVFVEMAERVAVRHPESVFVLAGGVVPGCAERAAALERRLRASSLAERIRYVGEVANGPGLIAALDLLVACPTRPDPFPRVVQEALWHGVPVLGVRSGGLPELVEDGRTGRLAHRSDPAELAAAIEEMMQPDTRTAMSRVALDGASRFSLSAFLESVACVLDRASRSRVAT